MTTYDAVVVGGGIVGAAVAYHLVLDGARALLIECADAGRATDAGAGILSGAATARRGDPVRRFEALAAAYYPHLVERLESDDVGDTGYAVRGSLAVAVSADEIPAFEAIRARVARQNGPERGLSLLTAAEARQLFPPLGQVHGALYDPGRARVDGHRLAAALVRAARARGLEVRHAGVDRIVLSGDAACGVAVGDATIGAGHVVVAAGAWTQPLCATIGLQVPVEPQRGQIAHLDVPDASTCHWPIVTGFRDHYMVPWDDGRVAVGATRECGAGFAPRTTVEGVMEVLAEALRVAPGLRAAGLREVRVGLRPASPDGLPILGPVDGVRYLLLATGHGRRGLQLGPYSGKAVAELITRGAAETDLSPFHLARFD